VEVEELNVLKPNKQTTIQTLLALGKSQREIARATGIDLGRGEPPLAAAVRGDAALLQAQLPPGGVEVWPLRCSLVAHERQSSAMQDLPDLSQLSHNQKDAVQRTAALMKDLFDLPSGKCERLRLPGEPQRDASPDELARSSGRRELC